MKADKSKPDFEMSLPIEMMVNKDGYHATPYTPVV